MKKKEITFTLSVDYTNDTAEFKDNRCMLPMIKTQGASCKDVAEIYRAAAANFLEMAFYLDNVENICTVDYNEDERDREYIKMCGENPFYFDC